MTNYIFILSLLFLAGCIGLALKPSPIYGGLGLIISGFVGCLIVLGFGGSFLGLLVFLIYLGGMMVVFGYTTAMATEEYPETWGSSWLIFGFLIIGFLAELFFVWMIDYWNEVELVNFDGLSDWMMYEMDDIGVMLEGGVGVAAMYSCATWMMVVAGWSLFAGIFIIIEITRD
uniref:NADH-ubiquinone oxidoreductase chain 6 n=1 Tax=Hylomyscus endorobae TaxID=1427027 RepID=A0A6B9M8P6_9MURI|nr:NADH dehydrogenase subunit 6 [Hylomyscus endorobae]QHB76938.1 NADH dehydrogenase subunit 6 [Hylomyscus endorobae]QHB76948.1 NADH dehydrogenase subunit 6 [Hylomyscus endorobae]QHB76974.1 NADH dehydrogenase subunit 6 [Hylomyscus endorobae]QHB76987.1 NADH dehydrogenase subunit 6 [Hylomyscus endorobae]QHB77000.1 NADH dehydrogenase subunit 6 [Hylomyscus endorobae]